MDWDMTPFFESPTSDKRVEFDRALRADLGALLERARELPGLSPDTHEDWVSTIVSYEDVFKRYSHLASYIGCLASCDASDELLRRLEGEVSSVGTKLDRVHTEIKRALSTADEPSFEKLRNAPKLAGTQHFLTDTRKRAAHMMSSELEGLASELSTDGFISWGRLYDTLTGKLTFEMEYPDGKREQLAIAQRRALMASPDRATRRAAFERGNEAFETIIDALGAALNHIAGTRLTLNRRRGVDHFLDIALQQAGISRRTLDAMFEAIEDRRELPRAALRLKAKQMDQTSVRWFDLEAPVFSASEASLSWDQARQLLETSFGRGYENLGAFFKKAIANKWVEYAPRKGKRPGAYCTHSELINEPRVYMTYAGTLGDVSTLAHEIGHAFHAEVMKDVRPLGRQYPMTLAESASTFAELLLNDGLMQNEAITDAQKAELLGETLNDAAAFLLDIPVRFGFERRFHELRQKEEVSVSELKALMASTQRDVFGDALEEGGEDPYYWASKLHFFITEVTFYNFPYTFGYLLSRGLYALYKERGPSFLPSYEAFLKNTGSDFAHKVAEKTLGETLESPAFWAKSIDSLQTPLDALTELLPTLKS